LSIEIRPLPELAERAEPRSPSPGAILSAVPEAAWLYALCATPVIFGAAYTRNFDLLKTLYFRGTMAVLVLVAIVAFSFGPWLTAPANGQARDWRALGRRQRAVVVAAGLVLGSVLLSTALGIMPRVSLAGSHLRNFGLFTESTHVLLFLAVLFGLRTVAQLWRAIDVLIASSVAVVVYGLTQAFGLDPLGPINAAGRGSPIVSTLGNSLFLGGYLVTAILATSARLASLLASPTVPHGADRSGLRVVLGGALYAAVVLVFLLAGARNAAPWWLLPAAPFVCLFAVGREWRWSPSRWTSRHDAAALACLLGLQLLALLRTGARTSWVALALALLLFVLWTVKRRPVRQAAVLGSAGAVLAVAIVLASSMSSSPIEGLRRAPIVGSLISAAGQRLSVESRVAIWKDVLALVRSEGVGLVAGDPFLAVRPLVGHGPGTLYVTLDQFTSEERAAVESARVDRAHNEILDRLATMGALGLMSWLALLATLVTVAIALLRGDLARSRERWAPAFVMAGLVGIAVADAFGPGDATSRVYFWFLAGALAAAPLLTAGSPAQVDGVTVAQAGLPPRAGANGHGASRRRRSSPARSSTALRAAEPIGWRGPWLAIGYATLSAAAAGLLALLPAPSSYGGHVALASTAVVLALFGLALRLSGASVVAIKPDRLRRSLGPIAAAALLLLFSIGLFIRNARPAEADLYNKAAVLASLDQYPVEAVLLARQAVAISPNEELYYMALGAAFGEIGKVAPERESRLPPGDALAPATDLPMDRMADLSRQDFFRLAEAAFLRARDLNPFDGVHYQNLVGLADLRAAAGDAQAKEQALTYLRTGLARMPSHPFLNAEYKARLEGKPPEPGGRP
jgi:O-antigen ligase